MQNSEKVESSIVITTNEPVGIFVRELCAYATGIDRYNIVGEFVNYFNNEVLNSNIKTWIHQHLKPGLESFEIIPVRDVNFYCDKNYQSQSFMINFNEIIPNEILDILCERINKFCNEYKSFPKYIKNQNYNFLIKNGKINLNEIKLITQVTTIVERQITYNEKK